MNLNNVALHTRGRVRSSEEASKSWHVRYVAKGAADSSPMDHPLLSNIIVAVPNLKFSTKSNPGQGARVRVMAGNVYIFLIQC